MIFPAQTLAGNWQQSDIPVSDDCSKLARACTGAARELGAARKLIEGYENQILAADARIRVALEEIESLKELSGLERDRAKQLENVIAAEREAQGTLLKMKEAQTQRIASLEKKLSRSRKRTWIVAAVVGVGVLLLARN